MNPALSSEESAASQVLQGDRVPGVLRHVWSGSSCTCPVTALSRHGAHRSAPAAHPHGGAAAMVVPQLTQLVGAAPVGDGWLHDTTATACMRGTNGAQSECWPAPGSIGPTNIRRSPRPWRRSTRAKPISAVSYSASGPTGSPPLTSSGSLRVLAVDGEGRRPVLAVELANRESRSS